jgi:hypothetical protein
MNQIRRDEQKRPEIRQLISDEEIKRRLMPLSILDTSKYALSGLMVLRKYVDGLPVCLLHSAVGSSGKATSGDFTEGLEREGYLTMELRKHTHGRQRWVTITKKGIQAVKERLKKK